MSKKILQDVIKIKNSKKIGENQKETISPEVFNKSDLPNVFIGKKQKEKISNNMLWVVAFIAIIFLFFAISFLFSNATITINPKTKDFALDSKFTAIKNAKTDELSYDLVILSGEESKNVEGGEEKDYSEYARGKVLIYNIFSSSAQTLSEDTRLEGSNGKIYKTKSKVIVPGMLKNGVPGKVGVDIYGAEAGEEYNSVPLDFKILGFKKTPKYSKFYARSVGEIKGGLKGKSRQISESEKENIIKELKDTLFAKLFQKAKDQTPKDFVLLEKATFLDVNEENIKPLSNEGSFNIGVKATFSGILLDKQKLEKEIINESLGEDDKSDVYISNIEDLIFSSSDKQIITLNDTKEITFKLVGTAKIVWKVDTEKLTENLLGRNEKDLGKILLQYPNIDSANSKIKPIWENSFPKKNKDIKIIVNYPK